MCKNTVPEDYEYDVLIRDVTDKPFYVLPGDSLIFTMEVHPSGKDNPPIEVNLQIDFREPFASDAVVVMSARADVSYPKILYPKDGEKANEELHAKATEGTMGKGKRQYV